MTVVQPVLASYRIPIFEEMSNSLEKTIVYADAAGADFGDAKSELFETKKVNSKVIGGLRFPSGDLLRECFSSRGAVLHVADFKFLSMWILLVFRIFNRRPVWLHGQGGYKKSGLLHKAVYTLSVSLSKGYICYTHYSADCLRRRLPKFLHKKISVVENTLYLKPSDSVTEPSSTDLFYIGRLREGCGIDILLESASQAGVNVRIIGAGDARYIDTLASRFSNAIFYGKIFDRDAQYEVAKSCMAGAYGGDAGLSVVHYMAFGLPVIVHGDIQCHMGPEPSYVVDGVNGLNFERANIDSLAQAIMKIKQDSALRKTLAENALATFNELASPSMASKFLKIMAVA